MLVRKRKKDYCRDDESRRKKDSCLLLDVGCWTDDMAMCVASRFPGVEIVVQQSRNSLTGFCVALTLPPSLLLGRSSSMFSSSSTKRSNGLCKNNHRRGKTKLHLVLVAAAAAATLSLMAVVYILYHNSLHFFTLSHIFV